MRKNLAPAITASFLLLLILYVASYLCLATQPAAYSTSGFSLDVPVQYRYGGAFAETVFAPANFLDRKVRRSYWRLDLHFEEN